MGRTAKPWYWEARKAYYAFVRGRRLKLGTTERDAKRKLKELLGIPPDDEVEGNTVSELFRVFLASMEANKATETHLWYKKHCDAFLSFLPEDFSAEELSTSHLQEWLDKQATWSDGTKHGAWRALNRAFRWGVKQGYCSLNPAADVEKPKAPNREVVVSKTEYKKILTLAQDREFKELIQVAFECGPRPQEILRVTAKDVDLDMGAWVFERTDSKGKKRRRVVFLNDAALKITKRRSKDHPTGPLFRNANGEAWTPFAVSCRFERMKKHIGQKYCLYHLRHSFCHHGLKAGIDPVTMAALMSHVDTKLISSTYSHLLHDAAYMREALKKLQ